MKSKTSVKKRIFAFLGIFVALLTIFTVFVSADNDDHGDYLNSNYIPTFDDYFNPNYIPTFDPVYGDVSWYTEYSSIVGGSTYIPLYTPEVSVIYSDENSVYGIVDVPITKGYFWDFEQGFVTGNSYRGGYGEKVFDYALTSRQIVSDYPHQLYQYDITRDFDYTFVNYQIESGDFWLYPRVANGLVEYSDLLTLIYDDDVFVDCTFAVSVSWQFAESGVINTSFFLEELSTGTLEIDYLELMRNCQNPYVTSYFNVSTRNVPPIYIHDLSVTISGIFNPDQSYIEIQIPMMKTTEHELYTEIYDLTYSSGRRVGFEDGYERGISENTRGFDLTMLFSAVSQVLSLPIIGYISFGGIISAFFALSVVLAVLGLFRGST